MRGAFKENQRGGMSAAMEETWCGWPGGIWEPEVGPLARRQRKQSAARALGQDHVAVVTCAAETRVWMGGQAKRHPCGSKSPATVIVTPGPVLVLRTVDTWW